MPEFFSQEWADSVRDALEAGPSEQARAGKLQEYWDFIAYIRSVYPASWALALPGLGVRPTCSSSGPAAGDRLPDHRPGRAARGIYVLGMDYADWKALHEGYDAQRTVMYRKMLLEEGELLEFFKAIYFFVEYLNVIGSVPGTYPETVRPVAAVS